VLFRSKINLQSVFGKETRLYAGDVLSASVRDDITPFTFMTISILGSYTTGE
jgi:hypothetical protein